LIDRTLRSTAVIAAAVIFASAQGASATEAVSFDATSVLKEAQERVVTDPAPTFEGREIQTAEAQPVKVAAAKSDDTYTEREVLEAITDLGGDISGSVADILAAVFQKAGRPSGVIVGEELQGAFIVGYRQGRGKVKFKSGGSAQNLVWRAPSVGFNIGASANKVTILVYNAKTIDRLLNTYASVQGSYHFILGGGITYMHEAGSGADGTSVNLAHVAIGVGFDAGVAIEGLTIRRN